MLCVFFSFSVWLAFPSVFLCFPSVFVGFPCFSIVFPAFSSLCLCCPSGFRWLSLFFRWFCFVFLTFSLVFLHFPDFSVFLFSFPSCFPVSCVFLFFVLLYFRHCSFAFTLDMLHVFPCFIGCLTSSWIFPPVAFVHCLHTFLLQHIWHGCCLLLLLVVDVVAVLVCSVSWRLTATVLVNDVAALLSLNEVAAGGQPLKEAGGGRGEGAAPPPQCVPCCSVLFVCALLLLLLVVETLLSLKKAVVCSFCCIAIVAPFFSIVVSDGTATVLATCIFEGLWESP